MFATGVSGGADSSLADGPSPPFPACAGWFDRLTMSGVGMAEGECGAKGYAWARRSASRM